MANLIVLTTTLATLLLQCLALKYEQGFQVSSGTPFQIESLKNCFIDLDVRVLESTSTILEFTFTSKVTKANFQALCESWMSQAKYVEFKTIPDSSDQRDAVEVFLKGLKLPYIIERPNCGVKPCLQYQIKTRDINRWNQLFCRKNGINPCE